MIIWAEIYFGMSPDYHSYGHNCNPSNFFHEKKSVIVQVMEFVGKNESAAGSLILELNLKFVAQNAYA